MEQKHLTDDERTLALEWYIGGKKLATIAQHFKMSWDQLLHELQPQQSEKRYE